MGFSSATRRSSSDHLANITLLRQDLFLARFFAKGEGPHIEHIANTKGLSFDKFAQKYADRKAAATPKKLLIGAG